MSYILTVIMRNISMTWSSTSPIMHNGKGPLVRGGHFAGGTQCCVCWVR